MHDPSEMPRRLAAFLADEEPGVYDVTVTSYDVMTGGYSRLLAHAGVEWRRDGVVETTTFVLRGDPPPERSLIDTDRGDEWELLHAVVDRCRIAAPRYFDDSGRHLGTRAIVLEHSPATSLLPYCAARAGTGVGDLPVRLAEAAAACTRSRWTTSPPASSARPATTTT